jgi:hypothetical protein
MVSYDPLSKIPGDLQPAIDDELEARRRCATVNECADVKA